jgi:hypothetical protein
LVGLLVEHRLRLEQVPGLGIVAARRIVRTLQRDLAADDERGDRGIRGLR